MGMKYVPMTLPTKEIEDAITMFVEEGLSDNEFIETIEQAVLSRIEQQGLVIVPREPSEEQWSGLARSIVMWWSFDNRQCSRLHVYLEGIGQEIPDWLAKEIPNRPYVPTKGTVAACIYKAMLEATKEST